MDFFGNKNKINYKKERNEEFVKYHIIKSCKKIRMNIVEMGTS